MQKFRQAIPALPVKAVGQKEKFYCIEVEALVERIVNEKNTMNCMTFCPVMKNKNEQAEAFNSTLFCQSPLFGIQHMWAKGEKIRIHDTVKVIKIDIEVTSKGLFLLCHI